MVNYDVIDTLSNTELKVFEYVMANEQQVQYMTIRELSEIVEVSTATVLRMISKMGFKQYSEFKYSLKRDLIDRHVFYQRIDYDELIACMLRLKEEHFQEKVFQSVDIIKKADFVVFLGIGDSNIVAEYGVRRFANNGILAFNVKDPYIKVSNYAKRSCVIVLSISGETIEIIREATSFKKQGCPIISITASANSSLSRISDLTLSYYVNERRKDQIDATSQIPAMGVLESLANILYK